ncbi:MAG TPA: DUF2510 domain-containing protein [Acidimicrobiales bacterium]|nr:DUF2510 domain-containing protein [Acidimicrobiales bacterium]
MSNAFLFVAIWLACAPSGYRISVRHQLQRGVTPWNFPSIVWALICLATGPLGILVEFFAGVTTRPAPSPPAAEHGERATVGRVDLPVRREAVAEIPDELPINPAAGLASPRTADGTTALFGWYPDVLRRHEFRYFDGKYWSEHVADAGVVSTDPVQR